MSRWASVVLGVVLIAGAAALPQSSATFASTTSNGANVFTAAAVFPSLRVVTYEVRTGAFTGTTYTLTLQNDLTADYFVIMRGGAGNGTTGGTRGPDENFARVSGDPHGNFATVTATNALRLERRGTTGDWQGQVTVVESIRDPLVSSFQLLDVVETSMGAGVTTASSASSTAWSDINQVGLYGGEYGGGIDSTNTGANGHQVGWAEIAPSGANTVNYRRQAGGGGNLNGTARFTTYVVEWGSEWTIQRATVSGNNGGNGVNALGEYDTAVINPVSRANTFVLAYGRSADNGLGDGFEGAIWTLGDGVNQNAVESLVAVGSEYTDNRTTRVYVHTHPDLRVDYRFGTDNGTGILTAAATGTMTIDATLEAETYDTTGSVWETGPRRMAVISNSSNGAGTLYPRPMVWARPSASTTATWTRSRTGQPGAFWLQSIDFALIGP